ncbi:MAG: hypothetical protein H0X47_14735 [Nitrospirales bacterium]|nr:hypothetical protein [Nitrospirales bacterium]
MTAVCSWLGAMASVWVVYRLWAIVPPMGTLARSIFAGVLAYTMAVLWPTAGVWVLVKLSVISVLILLTYLVLREFSPDEIALARSFLRRSTVPVEQRQE